MKKLLKSGIAVLLTLCLLFGLCGSALAAAVGGGGDGGGDGDAKPSYVAIGDSYANGYGLYDYVRTDAGGNWVRGYGDGASGRAYPGLVAGDAYDLTSLTVSGMRTGEFHYLMDQDYVGDGYTQYFAQNILPEIANSTYGPKGGIDGLRKEFAADIEGADLITYGLGVNDFGTYLSQRLLFKLGAGGNFGDGYKESLQDILDELPDGDIKDKAQEIYDDVMDELREKAPAIATDMADGFAYAFGAFAINFAAGIDHIRALNPDAQIIVLSIPNQMKGVRVSNAAELAALLGVPAEDLAGLPENLDFGNIGDLYGEMLRYANLYMASYLTATLDPNCAFVDIDGFETFYEALGQGSASGWKFTGTPVEYEAPILYGGLTGNDYTNVSEFSMAGLAGLFSDQLASRLGGLTDGVITVEGGSLASAVSQKRDIPQQAEVPAAGYTVELTFSKNYNGSLISITPTSDEAELNALNTKINTAIATATYDKDDNVYKANVDASVADVLALLHNSEDDESVNKLSTIAGVGNVIWSLSDSARIHRAFDALAATGEAAKEYAENTIVYTLAGGNGYSIQMTHAEVVTALYTGILQDLVQAMKLYPVTGENPISDQEIATLYALVKAIIDSMKPAEGEEASDVDPQAIIGALGLIINPTNIPAALMNLPCFPAILSIYARYMMAEGVGNHPTPDGYDYIAKKILAAVADPDAYAPNDLVKEAIEEMMEAIGESIWEELEDRGYVQAVNDLYNTVKDQAVLPALAQIQATADAAWGDVAPAMQDVKTAADDVIDALQDVADALADIENHADGQDGDELAAAEARLTALFATLDKKVQALQAAVEALDKAYNDYRDDVENAFDDAKANIMNAYGEAKAKAEAMIEKDFPGTTQTEGYKQLANAVDEFVQKASDAVDKGKAAALKAIDEAEGNVSNAARELLKEITPAVKDISAAAAAKDPTKYTKIVVAIMEKGKEIYDEIVEAIEFIMSLPDMVKEAYEMMLEITGFGFYVKTDYSKYVSIGDSMATGFGLDAYDAGENAGNYGFRSTVDGSYASILANDYLGLEAINGNENQSSKYDDFVQLGCGGLRTEDIGYILGAGTVTDSYTVHSVDEEILARAKGDRGQVKVDGVETIEDLRAYFAAELIDADLVTVQMGANNFTTFITGQMEKMHILDGGPIDPTQAYERNWAAYFDDEVIEGIDAAREALAQAFVLSGMEPAAAEAYAIVIESYFYGYAGFSFNYCQTLDKIHELAPNAVVVVIGMYNPLKGAVLTVPVTEEIEMVLPLGQILRYLIKGSNIQFMGYALNSELKANQDTVFVATEEGTTTFFQEEYGITDESQVPITEYIGRMFADSGRVMHAGDAGNEFIAEQIADSLWVLPAYAIAEDLTYTGSALEPEVTAYLDFFGPEEVEEELILEGPYFYKVSAEGAGEETLTPVEQVIDKGTYRAFLRFVSDWNNSVTKVVSDDFEVKGSTPAPIGGGGSVNYKLILADATNGKLEFTDFKNRTQLEVAAGTQVKLTATPAANYKVDKVTYTTKNNSTPVELKANADGTYTIKMPSADTTVTATFKPQNENDPSVGRLTIANYTKGYLDCDKGAGCLLKQFRDLDPNEWYHDGIHFCLENKIMQGFGTPEFLPFAETTRAQVVTTLWNIAGHPIAKSSITFSDVKSGQWFYDAIMWAAANGIVDGYGDGTFGPNDFITHEQIAKIFYGYAKFYGYDVSETTDITGMDGYEKVSPWARPFVAWGVATGLCCGKDGNTSIIAAPEKANRAELASTILNFCTLIAAKDAAAAEAKK